MRTDVTGVNYAGQAVDLGPALQAAVRSRMKLSMTLYDPAQLDTIIDDLVLKKLQDQLASYMARKFSPKQLSVEQVNPHLKEFGNLRLALHAMRYHQRQFLWRWMFLRNKYLLATQRPGDYGTEVRVDDLPLRFELQTW